MSVDGKTVPSEVYIEINGNQFRLDKENRVKFNYTFKNIQKSTRFHLFADGYTSKEYELSAIPNPSVLNFNVSLTYPSYIGKQPEQLSNTGDLNIPGRYKGKMGVQRAKCFRHETGIQRYYLHHFTKRKSFRLLTNFFEKHRLCSQTLK